LIDAEKANYPIRWMCSLLRVPRSTFYEWRRQALRMSATAARRADLAEKVTVVFEEFRQTYGCRRIARELNARGIACSVGLVADLMRDLGLRAVQPRMYRVTTVHGSGDTYPGDLIERDFTSHEPGTKMVGDITYLRTKTGWCYLAVVIDLATRMVVGWQIADHMRSQLVIDALMMAHHHGHLRPGAVFHSDRGVQYAADDYATYCMTIGVRQSMGRTGVCWDNAAAESFFATLKNEMYSRYVFATMTQARFAVAEYIEVFYNRKRMHSTLGYRTPAQALTDYRSAALAA
jgi:transposase InsO family protein